MDGGSSARPGWPGAAAVADVHQAEKKNKGRNQIYREFVHKYKSTLGCEFCSYNKHPAALHFDHLIPKNKSFNIGTGQNHPCAATGEFSKDVLAVP